MSEKDEIKNIKHNEKEMDETKEVKELLIKDLWKEVIKYSKNSNEIISIAPWLFGSTIFYKETENFKTMLNTLENHPIDSLCTSSNNYKILQKIIE